MTATAAPSPAARRLRRPDGPTLVVLAAACVYATAYSWLSLRRQEAFWHARFDVGNMVQAVWSTAHGDFLSSTSTSGEQITRLAAHVDPLLALFAPLWWLWPAPEMLLVAQSIGLAAGALPVFWLGRRWLGDDRLAVAGSLVYLLNPALGWTNVTEFHPVAFAAPLILFAIWAAVERHEVTLVVCASLAALSKEQVGLSLAVLGVWMAVSLGRRRAGLTLTAASLAWVAFAVGWVIPHFNEGRESVFIEGRYGELGDSPSELVITFLTRPDRVVATIAEWERISYVLAMLIPVGFLALFAPLLAAGALPDLILNTLSSRLEQHQVEYHYVAVIVPFLVAGAVRGLASLRGRERPGWLARGLARPWPVAAAFVGVTVASAWYLGPLPVWKHVGGSDWRTNEYVVDDHARVLARAVALVPDDGDVVVSATNHVGAHLSERRRIYTFPVVRDAEWVVVDRKRPETIIDVTEADLEAALAALARRPDMRRVFSEDGVSVFRRVGQTSTTSTTSSRSRTATSTTGVVASSSTSSR